MTLTTMPLPPSVVREDHPSRVLADDLVALGEATGTPLPGAVLDHLSALGLLQQVRDLVSAAGGSWPQSVTRPLAEVTLAAPFPPGKIVGVGLNYVEHVAEFSRTLDTDKDLPTRAVLQAGDRGDRSRRAGPPRRNRHHVGHGAGARRRDRYRFSLRCRALRRSLSSTGNPVMSSNSTSRGLPAVQPGGERPLTDAAG